MPAPSSEVVVATFHDLVDRAILAGIGRVNTGWASLEAVIEDSIASFLGSSIELICPLTVNINISMRVSAMEALAQLRLGGDDFERFKSVVKNIKISCHFGAR